MAGFYLIRMPWWIRWMYPRGIWRMPTKEPKVYLTFDDGPHPTITPWVLDLLRSFQAKATFFCIGNNVAQFPEVFHSILSDGHRVGNHTYDHVNGWKTDNDSYLENVMKAQGLIDTNLFRPPFGRIRRGQAKNIRKTLPGMKIIFWDLLSADFDVAIESEACIENVIKRLRPGTIIVFHDSEKAFPRLERCLPVIIETMYKKGYKMEAIP